MEKMNIKISKSTMGLASAKRMLDEVYSVINGIAEEVGNEETYKDLYRALNNAHNELNKVIGTNAGRIMSETNYREI